MADANQKIVLHEDMHAPANESARLKFSKATPRTCAWNASANPSRRTIDWRFTTADARRIFGYKQSVRTSAARRSPEGA